jgi:hypothetical protein
MIYLAATLSWPFWKNRFTTVWERDFPISHNKSLELGLYKGNAIVGFSFSWTFRQSHAGLSFDLELLGWQFTFNQYDHRHWDDENECWETYEDDNNSR